METDQLTRGQLEAEFSALARTMYFTGTTIAAFAKGATRGPLFVTEPDREDEAVDEFIDPRSGVRVDATTGEVL